MKVSVKNYNIVKQASLEFIPGLNVITGPSNNGKSSIFKAIKALTYTVPGTNSIRSGESSYSVGIMTNGHTVLIQKGLKESVYMVDGEKYTKFGQTTPEQVSKALNMKELVLNGNKEQLNFWDQMEYPFLLDKTPVELFRFIIDSGDNDQISSALKTMVSDRQQISKSIDQLQGSINVVDEEIKQYEERLSNAETIIESCNGLINLQPKVARLERLKLLRSNIHDIRHKQSRADMYGGSLTRKLNIHNNSFNLLQTKINNLSKLNTLFVKLTNNIGDLSDINENKQKLSSILILNQIDSSKLNLMNSYKSKLNNIIDKRKCLEIKPHTSWNSEIDKSIDKYNKLIGCYKRHKDLDYRSVDLSTSIIAFKTSNKNYTDMRDCFDVCPYCGNKIHI